MRNIKDEVDASWFTSDPDAEHKRIHKKFRAQADWMLVNVPQLPHLYEDIQTRQNTMARAKTLFEARMIAEFRQIGHSAKKSSDAVDHWDRLTSKHEGLRCRNGYDKPLNEEGCLKKMIHSCEFFRWLP